MKMVMNNYEIEYNDTDVAIIGMSGRFPGAKNTDELWNNLLHGKESITLFNEDQDVIMRCKNKETKNNDFIKAYGVLDNIKYFDANFFEVNQREAEFMDPQQRVCLECAWEALEDAGYCTDYYDGQIGVFMGASPNTYLLNNIVTRDDLFKPQEMYKLMMGNMSDLLPMMISYKLNFTGPSMNIQSACSTSLVSVHMASQSILNGECDLALAGGVSIKIPQAFGYLYEKNMIISPDGHCRPFDENANGTVFGSGAGVVVLKRLYDAINDGDNILAVIKGSAVNNDGAVKVGFTAPSIIGQAKVIAEAQSVAQIHPNEITYVEAHGTGTEIGDPVEIEALTKAFSLNTARKNYCAIGSIKSNIGHLDVAAGVASLIKTVLALKHKKIPPTINYTTSNPKINFKDSPFYVNSRLSDWNVGTKDRIASVSSLGFGGTNAHLILSDYKDSGRNIDKQEGYILMLSAKTKSSLQKYIDNLRCFFEKQQLINMVNVEYTLAVGRKDFKNRIVIDCESKEDAIHKLSRINVDTDEHHYYDQSNEDVIFYIGDLMRTHDPIINYKWLQTSPYERYYKEIMNAIGPKMKKEIKQIINDDRKCNRNVKVILNFIKLYVCSQYLISIGITPKLISCQGYGMILGLLLSNVISINDALALLECSIQLGDVDANESKRVDHIKSLLLNIKYSPQKIKLFVPFKDCFLDNNSVQDVELIMEIICFEDQISYKNILSQNCGVSFILGSMNNNQGDQDFQLSLEGSKNGFPISVLDLFSVDDDIEYLKMRIYSDLWLKGMTINWSKLLQKQGLKRVSLPTYPFERKDYWIESRLKYTSISKQENSTKKFMRPQLSVEYEEHHNQVQQVILLIWQELMYITTIGINDNFFELGGDSIIAIQIVARLNEVFQIDLSAHHLFAASTPSELAVRIIKEIEDEDLADEIAELYIYVFKTENGNAKG